MGAVPHCAEFIGAPGISPWATVVRQSPLTLAGAAARRPLVGQYLGLSLRQQHLDARVDDPRRLWMLAPDLGLGVRNAGSGPATGPADLPAPLGNRLYGESIADEPWFDGPMNARASPVQMFFSASPSASTCPMSSYACACS